MSLSVIALTMCTDNFNNNTALMELYMRLTRNYQLRITPDLDTKLACIPDGKVASVIRSGVDMYFDVGWVLYEIEYSSGKLKYFGIAETRKYFDCSDYRLKVIGSDSDVGQHMMINPLSEYSIRLIGVFGKLDELVLYRDWLLNHWLNSGGNLYNEYDGDFVRTFQIALKPSDAKLLLSYCLSKGKTVQKLMSSLVQKLLNK